MSCRTTRPAFFTTLLIFGWYVLHADPVLAENKPGTFVLHHELPVYAMTHPPRQVGILDAGNVITVTGEHSHAFVPVRFILDHTGPAEGFCKKDDLDRAGSPHPDSSGETGVILAAFSPGGDSLDVVLEALKNSRQTIDLLMYYFSKETITQALCYLALQRGIRIRMFVDESMNRDPHRSRFEYLAAHGIKVYVESLPVAGKLHMKCAIIDGHTIITGAANWSDSAFERNVEDVVVIHSEPFATPYRNLLERIMPDFDEMTLPASPQPGSPVWTNAYPKATISRLAKINSGTPRKRFFGDVIKSTSWFSPGREAISIILDRIATARDRVDIGMYLLSDPETIQALAGLARSSDIPIRLLTDDIMLRPGYLETLKELKRAGIEILFLKRKMGSLHLKTVVIDDHTVFTGSMNWTKSAFEKNVENLVEFRSKKMARYYRKYLDMVAGYSRPFHLRRDQKQSLRKPQPANVLEQHMPVAQATQ